MHIMVNTFEQTKRAMDQVVKSAIFEGWRWFALGNPRAVSLVPSPSAGSGIVTAPQLNALERAGLTEVRACFNVSPEPGVYVRATLLQRPNNFTWEWDDEMGRYIAEPGDGTLVIVERTISNRWRAAIYSAAVDTWWASPVHEATPEPAKKTAVAYYLERAP